MKFTLFFVALMATGVFAVAIEGCNATGTVPQSISNPPLPSPTPASKLLYVDQNGTFYEYQLPLTAASKPVRTLPEWPGLPVPPQIAADQFGNVALASPQSIRFYRKPIVSFSRSHAYLELKLVPAITQVGPNGADLSDIEYDPNENLWLLNNLGAGSGGGGISELRPPITKSSKAALTIAFGAPGSKAAGFTTLVQARFDINAALYVYASSSTRSRLFKISFPYAKPPGTTGLNLAQANFIDSSEWPPTASNAPSLLIGQYDGALRSPKPGSPPSPPVNAMAQFPQPFNPSQGRYPDAHIVTIAGAMSADTYRYSFYALDEADGNLNVYDLPMKSAGSPKFSIKCPGGASDCSHKPQHLFLAP